MNGSGLKKPVDALLILAAALLFGSGIGMALGTNRGVDDYHLIAGLVFAVLVVVHVVLSGEWIFRSLAGGKSFRIFAGLAVVLVLLLTGMFVQLKGEGSHERERRQTRQGW